MPRHGCRFLVYAKCQSSRSSRLLRQLSAFGNRLATPLSELASRPNRCSRRLRRCSPRGRGKPLGPALRREEFPLYARALRQRRLPAIRDLQNPPRRESLFVRYSASSQRELRHIECTDFRADQLFPVLPNKIRGDPPQNARRAGENGRSDERGVPRIAKRRVISLCCGIRCRSLRCPSTCATNRVKRPPARTVLSPALPPIRICEPLEQSCRRPSRNTAHRARLPA